MLAGDTFLFPGRDDHLWMIISDVDANPDQLVVVFFLSWQERHDQACLMEAGEHPFIKHRTCVNYPSAAIVPNSRLEEMKAAGELRMKERLSDELLDKIRACTADADIPTECHAILREQGFVP